jgi:hypothetical protein
MSPLTVVDSVSGNGGGAVRNRGGEVVVEVRMSGFSRVGGWLIEPHLYGIMTALYVPDRTSCNYCGKVGFVRRQFVIKARQATVSYYCGACNRSWDVSDERAQPRRQPDEHKRRS